MPPQSRPLVSQSKKVNKQDTNTKKKNAQKPVKKASARSSTRKSSVQSVTEPEQTLTSKPRSTFRTNVLRAVAFLGVIGITVYIYSIRDHVEDFKQFGYAGIFLIALMANATVLLPAPGVAIIYAMGAIFNPFLVGLAAGTGGALGELSGYLAGFSGQAVIERTDIYNRFKPWVDRYGGWAILVLSAIPNPFFDVAGIAAGIAKMPMSKFLIFTWVGQIIKMTSFAVAGYYSIEWLTNFFR
jgi:membrane protein DedA with SNARE-associated domain